MHNSDAVWRIDGQRLWLSGHWFANDVAALLPQLPYQQVTQVDVSGVERLDSSLMTVFLALLQSEKIVLQGVKSSCLSLLHLYDLCPLFIIEEAV